MTPPWLDVPKRQIDSAIEAGRLAHAILIAESPGAGGALLATWIAQRLLCVARDARPCGQCLACRGVALGQYPDLYFLRPGDDSPQIRIDDVRVLSAELALTSHAGGHRVAIIAPADAMNVMAANALLKTLEEPPPGAVLLLVSSRPARLPATVRSRCLRLVVGAPPKQDTLAWLEALRPGDYRAAVHVLGNAPLTIAACEPDHVGEVWAETGAGMDALLARQSAGGELAERWARGDLSLRLACLETWLTDQVHHALGVARETGELGGRPRLQGGAEALNIASLFELLDGIRELRRMLDTPLNKSLALEQWLGRAVAATTRGPVPA